jgi:hypothetical protein
MDELIDKIDQLIAKLSGSHATTVKSAEFKQSAIAAGKLYFQSCRDSLEPLVPKNKLGALDENWQHLIRLAHGRSSRLVYVKCLTSLKRGMTELNIIAISNPKRSSVESQRFTSSESLLIKTLSGLVPSAAASYIQGIVDLAVHGRVSYRGCACEFREAFREILDHLAPDDDVMKAAGFSLEKDRKLPTMKQKVRFVLKSRGLNQTRSGVAEKALELIDSLCGDIARAIYDRASLATHVETSHDEVLQLKRYVDTLLFDLLAIRQ